MEYLVKICTCCPGRCVCARCYQNHIPCLYYACAHLYVPVYARLIRCLQRRMSSWFHVFLLFSYAAKQLGLHQHRYPDQYHQPVYLFFLSFSLLVFHPSSLQSFVSYFIFLLVLQSWSEPVCVCTSVCVRACVPLLRWILCSPHTQSLRCSSQPKHNQHFWPGALRACLCVCAHVRFLPVCVCRSLSACPFKTSVQGRLSRQPPSAFLNGRAPSSPTGSCFMSGGQERLRHEQTKRT